MFIGLDGLHYYQRRLIGKDSNVHPDAAFYRPEYIANDAHGNNAIYYGSAPSGLLDVKGFYSWNLQTQKVTLLFQVNPYVMDIDFDPYTGNVYWINDGEQSTSLIRRKSSNFDVEHVLLTNLLPKESFIRLAPELNLMFILMGV